MAEAEPSYGLDNAWEQAMARLTSLQEWLDPGTTRHLIERGVGPGWRCWEVGAGGGSIAAWLCDRVGVDGRVLATDLDTRFVERIEAPNLRIEQHDVAVGAIPEQELDLVHCRLLLAHLPTRDDVLPRLVSALRRGGWLVAEEMDFVSVATDESRPGGGAFLEAVRASNDVLRRRGFDPEYGRKLLDALRGTGLVAVSSEGRAVVWPGGSSGATAWRLTFEQLRTEMVESGADDATIDAAVALCQDPSFSFMSQVTMATWGRRP